MSHLRLNWFSSIALICFMLSSNSNAQDDKSANHPSVNDANTTIEFVTDIEGNWPRLESYLRRSDIFAHSGNGEWELKSGTHFVFGGDAIDRGPGDLKVLQFLVSLKQRYPMQVTLLLGNRDINKMPILDLAREFEDHRDYSKSKSQLERFLSSINARGAFEFRRQELAEQGTSGQSRQVSDQEVVDSFFKEIQAGGLLRRLLELGEIGAIVDGNIFSHGVLTKDNIQAVPDGVKHSENIRERVRNLNQWKADQLQGWSEDPSWSEDPRKGKALLDYQVPQQSSWVNSRNADSNNNPNPMDPGVIDLLIGQGISRAFSGHTPEGDSPSILRDPLFRFENVIGDISYSRGNAGPKIQMRGDSLLIEAVLPDGRPYSAKTRIRQKSLIGRKTTSGALIVGKLENGSYLTHRFLPGFKLEQLVLTEEQAILSSGATYSPCQALIDAQQQRL